MLFHVANSPFEDLVSLNRLIHEPGRLAILTALSACDEADFVFLLNLTGLTKGNLSSHLAKLEEGGLVDIRKTFEDRQPVTYVRLTPEGRAGVKRYWDRMEKVRKGVRALKPLRSIS